MLSKKSKEQLQLTLSDSSNSFLSPSGLHSQFVFFAQILYKIEADDNHWLCSSETSTLEK